MFLWRKLNLIQCYNDEKREKKHHYVCTVPFVIILIPFLSICLPTQWVGSFIVAYIRDLENECECGVLMGYDNVQILNLFFYGNEWQEIGVFKENYCNMWNLIRYKSA